MTVGNWDAYWRNARSAAAHKDGGPQDEVLERFWTALFRQVLPTMDAMPDMLDIACGNGAVPRFALATSKSLEADIDLHICGLDESPAALKEMCKRHPALRGIAANALSLPFQDGVFDLVTSQFGMEYAGLDVTTEVARVLGPGGVLAAVLHRRGGGIYKECEINLRAIDDFRHSNLLFHFETLFTEVMATQQGQSGNEEQLRRTDGKFATSVAATEAIFQRWGKDVAGGTLFRVYTDIGHMYRRLDAYKPDEMLTWIDVMSKELDSYSGRMSSMLAAALDEAHFEAVLARLRELGLAIRIKDTLVFGRQTLASAWVLVAEKPGV